MLKTLNDILAAACGRAGGAVAVAAAHDKDVLTAVAEARRRGICNAVLIGREDEIRRLLEELCEDYINYDIIPVEYDADIRYADTVSAKLAVNAVASGRASFLMKGMLNTTDMLRQVVAEGSGLATGRLLSHVMLYETPAYPRLIADTDGGMNPHPDLEKKKGILENAARLLKALGYGRINAACIAGSEVVSEKIQATVDAAALAQMDWSRFDMSVYGPVGLDLAISPEACRHKRYIAEGAGEADILLMPTYEVGNGIGKALTYFGGARSAGVVVGASAPIVLVSRSDPAEVKLLSLALGKITSMGGTL